LLLLLVKSLPNVLLYGFLGIVAFGAVAFLLTSTVTYHPFGVPEYRRQEYREKLTTIKLYKELAEQADESTRPVVVTEETTFNFGMVDPHSTLSHSFVVRNAGQLPLQLTVKETSCKCTVGQLGSPFVPPGEETQITLTWNTGYQADEYEQTALVTTNDPLQKEIELKVSGEVRAEFVVPQAVEFEMTDVGKPATASFYVYSQLWDDFEVVAMSSELRGFQWAVEPVSPDDVHLLDAEAKSAWKVDVSSAGNSRGKFSAEVSLTAQPIDGSKPVLRKLAMSGKVRAPISFYSPDIHRDEGLDIGTLTAGKEHLFHLIVRSRSDRERKMEVLDVKPEQLHASVAPVPQQPGSYRLTLKIPKDCPMVMFNANTKHGYVQVGDPNDKSFSNWFPVMGAVVKLDD
jgi:hypothetical protein